MRLIDADELKKAIEGLVVGGAEGLKDYYENGSKSDENDWIGGIYDAWELIDNAPTVDVDEKIETYKNAYRIMSDAFENEVRKNTRQKGEWIGSSLTFGDILNCSICGARPRRSEYGYDLHDNFCPNCGAEMRKGGAE